MQPLNFCGTVAGVWRQLFPNRPKIDPLMSAPRSPNGKRLLRPIIPSTLAAKDCQDEVDELRQAIDRDIRQLIRCLVLWIAFLAILYFRTVPWA